MADLADRPDPEIGEQLFGRFDAAGEVTQRGLLSSLRDAGLPVGPREQIAVSAVIAELISMSETPVSLGDLGSHIAPLVARSPQERETFFRVFDALAPGWKRSPDVAPSPKPPEPNGPDIRKPRPPVWRRVRPALVVIAITVLAGWLVYRFLLEPSVEPEPPVAVTTETPADNQPPAETEPVEADVPYSLTRIREIAGAVPYYHAPTLEEIGRELAVNSEIGWSAEAYTQRLHELTGLPQRTPIGMGRLDDEIITIARVGAALDMIERPNSTTSVRENIESLYRLNDGRASDYSEAKELALQMSDVFEEDVAEILLASTDKTEAISTIRASIGVGPETLPDQLLERALAVSIEPRHHRIWPDAPWLQSQPPANESIAPWWTLILATALPLLAGFLWLANQMRRKKAYLRRRKPEFPPLHMDLLAEAATEIKANAGLFRRAAQRLAQRTPRATNRLDVERTVLATIREGGVSVSPVFQELRAEPEYLVLIEKRAGGDHDFERLRQMARQLEPVIKLDIYSYQTDPSILQADRGGKIEALDRVLARHGDHRLLVLGSGVGFLEPRSQKPVASAEKLMRIERRALLTPLPLAEWANEEVALARELDMPIGRATPKGLLELAELLRLDGAEDDELLKPDGDGRARPLPDMLRLRGGEFLYETPPGDDEDRTIAQLVLDLRNYLDGPGFDWLCALAVYPAIQWDLTLYLGVALAAREGGDAKTAKLYSEERLAAIAQLPWFRDGEMPNWLRRALIARLSPGREGEVRGAIKTLLDDAKERPTKAENDQVWFRISEEPVKESRSPEELFEDEVLLDFMARGDLEDFETERVDLTKQENKRRGFSWEQLAGPGLAVAYAAAAFAVVPKPWEGALITGAWLPLVLLALGGVAGLALGNGRASYALVRSGSERVAAYGLIFSVMMAGLWIAAKLADWPVNAPSLLFLASLVFVVFAGRFVASLAGVFVPATDRVWLRVSGIVLASLMTAAFAIVSSLLANSISAQVLLIAAGLSVFSLGVFAARYAPEKLPPPKEKIPLGTKPRVWPNALRGGAILAGALPALALAALFTTMHVRVPPVAGVGEVVPERILATSPDGRFFATGDTLGEIAVFKAASPSQPLTRIQLEREPVTSLAVRETDEGRIVVAAASLTGSVRLFDGRGGSQTLDTGIIDAGLRPQVALGPDGGWAVAGQDESGAAFLTTNVGDLSIPADRIPLGLASTDDIPGRWVYAIDNGSVEAVSADGFPTRVAQSRLASRPRWVRVAGNEVRALGEDGTMLVAQLTLVGLENARILPADERFVLGEIDSPIPCSTVNQHFIVYFEADSMRLSPQAEAIMNQAITNVRERSDCALTEVFSIGHTDTVGSSAYNQRLSQRMATSIASELVARGVPPEIISTAGRGETALARATADAVREPLNRRVEVSLFVSQEIEPDDQPEQPDLTGERGPVYIQIADENQRGEAEGLRARLLQQGLNAPGVELNLSQSPVIEGEVRYFREEDAALADLVREELTETAIEDAQLMLVPASVGTPEAGQVEIWWPILNLVGPLDCETLAAQMEAERTTGAIGGVPGQGAVYNKLSEEYDRLCVVDPVYVAASMGCEVLAQAIDDEMAGAGDGILRHVERAQELQAEFDRRCQPASVPEARTGERAPTDDSLASSSVSPSSEAPRSGVTSSSMNETSSGAALTPRTTFRDCEICPEMVVVPAGAFTIGSPASEAGRRDDEGPQRRVRIAEPFAVGRFEVTFDEWDTCVAEGGCNGYRPDDEGWGRGDRPVIAILLKDASAYVDWISRKTGEDYRLLSEAEWEYVARAGTTTRFSWGEEAPVCERGAPNGAVFSACDGGGTQAVGFSAPNGFGVHDMHGNVMEWVEGCYAESYSGAPTDGSAWIVNDCRRGINRGGSWGNDPWVLRSAFRNRGSQTVPSISAGFRVARTVSP